jgi:hypothetical protein
LIIYDCFENDNRFAWDHYTDGSIRPRNNPGVCIEQEFDVTGGESADLILDVCNDKYKAFGFRENTSSRRRKLTPAEELVMHESLPIRSHKKKELHSSSAEETSIPELSPIRSLEEKSVGDSDDNCEDSPMGWYDIMGRNCEWYSEEESNCKVYGDSYKNFGKTALSACCVCGGGPIEEMSLGDSDIIGSTMVMTQAADTCEDSPMGWYDIMGRNCEWYSEEESNCEVYGDSYKNFGKTAFSACCVCGGGPIEEDDVSCDSSDGCEIENEQGCWDQLDWYDSTGDGCSWYSEESNHCNDYGSRFASEDYQTAKNACCVCGGGLSEVPHQKNESIPGCSDSPYNWYVPCCASASFEFFPISYTF